MCLRTALPARPADAYEDLSELPSPQRAVVFLRDVLGWSAMDTAALLDTTVAATDRALATARARLNGRETRA